MLEFQENAWTEGLKDRGKNGGTGRTDPLL